MTTRRTMLLAGLASAMTALAVTAAVALNPQPLPPKDKTKFLRSDRMLNPQPLPPRSFFKRNVNQR